MSSPKSFLVPNNLASGHRRYTPITSSVPARRNSAETPLLGQSTSNYSAAKRRSFANQQLLLDGLHFHQNILEDNSDSNYDFDGSQPSLSDVEDPDDLSLDDVCLPVDGLETKNWPDLAVLNEFYEEEMREALLLGAAEGMGDMSDGYSTVDEERSVRVGFQYPLVSKIDNPSLATKKINETEAIKGRLRPPTFSPWDKSTRQNLKQYLPTETGERRFQQFRYTYFRPDLDATIHSPSISGLLQDGQTFADLFVVSQYHNVKPPAPILKDRLRPEGMQTPKSSLSASPAPADPVPFWLDVLDPTEEEMKVLSKAFGIHPLTTEDIFLNEAREKVELFKDYYFVCFRLFDIVQERLKRKALNEKLSHLESLNMEELTRPKSNAIRDALGKILPRREYTSLDRGPDESMTRKQREAAIASLKLQIKRQKSRYRELAPLNFYIIVFHGGVITFHFSPTPHPVTVRRRARLLKDYLTVSSDWIAYALIDDITDAFGPMIETIEEEVYAFEDAILRLHSGLGSDLEDLDDEDVALAYSDVKTVLLMSLSLTSLSVSTSSAEWQRKGDMLRRIGECRKRIMTLLRLLGSKADVIKGLAKRCNENFDVAPRLEIGMYLGDIQDHIITMVQSLNHYEKLLARSHLNYLAQINIDMTKVNNDMNDVLGKILILGTLVLPMNVITGLWGMNVIVPGQDHEGLVWFFGILLSMLAIAAATYFVTVKVYNF